MKQKYQNSVRNALFAIFPALSASRSTGFLPGKLDFAIRAAYFMSNSLVTEMLPVLLESNKSEACGRTFLAKRTTGFSGVTGYNCILLVVQGFSLLPTAFRYSYLNFSGLQNI